MSLHTTDVRRPEDIRAFFDRLAPAYADRHGPPDRLLRYRLQFIDELLADTQRGTLVEIGCGTGLHLLPLAGSFQRAIGTDLSPGMLAVAELLRQAHPEGGRVAFRADPAERLATIGDAVADVVLCVGVLEHLSDQAAAIRQAARVLKPGGAFVGLTPNGDHVWYRWLAPLLGVATRHLSTDRFLGRRDLTGLLGAAGLRVEQLGSWTFVPRGDLPRGWAGVLGVADWAGRGLGLEMLRGGLSFRAVKPRSTTPASVPAHRSGE